MAKKKLIKKQVKKQKVYEPLPMTTQLVFNDLALSRVGYYCDKIYYMIEGMNFLMADLPELEKELKKKFPKHYHLLKISQIIATEIKVYYDGLDGHQIAKDDLTSERFISFKKALPDLPFINKPLYKMFYFLIKRTKLKNYSIPSIYFRMAERKYKSFEPKDEQAHRDTHDEDEDEV